MYQQAWFKLIWSNRECCSMSPILVCVAHALVNCSCPFVTVNTTTTLAARVINPVKHMATNPKVHQTCTCTSTSHTPTRLHTCTRTHILDVPFEIISFIPSRGNWTLLVYSKLETEAELVFLISDVFSFLCCLRESSRQAMALLSPMRPTLCASATRMLSQLLSAAKSSTAVKAPTLSQPLLRTLHINASLLRHLSPTPCPRPEDLTED